MPSMILECPHCGAEKIGFTLAAEVLGVEKTSLGYSRYRVLLICSNCEDAVVAVIDYGRHAVGHSPMGCGSNPVQNGWKLRRVYPTPKPSSCPRLTPDDLKRLYVQADNAFKRGDADASGTMSRKVVDVSTQQLLKEKSKDYENIFQRIEALAEQGKLTDELKDWAHQIRIGGADAAHDLDPYTDEEAEEQLEFAELYLIYVYTLPKRLEERKAKTEKEKADAKKVEENEETKPE